MSISTNTYWSPTRHLHWLTAIAIVILFSLGWTMVPMEISKQKLDFYSWHKWLGLFVLLVICLRLGLRFVVRPPKHNDQLPAMIVKLATLGHWALYATLLLLPLTGWLRSSTAGIEIKIFEIFQIPNLMQKNEELSKYFETVHWALGWVLLVLLAGHIAAVFIHHTVFKDRILRRMPPATIYLAAISLLIVLGFVFNSAYPPANNTQVTKVENQEKQTKTIESNEKHASITKGAKNPWQLQKSHSKLTFAITQKGVATEGEFKKYNLALNFDPTRPDLASVKVDIDIKGMTFGNQLVDSTLHGPEWFDANAHPTAQFNASSFQKLQDNDYLLKGALTIRSIAKKLSLPLKITITEDINNDQSQILNAKGTVTILRRDYEIGKGEWESTETLANEVIISIDMKAKRNK